MNAVRFNYIEHSPNITLINTCWIRLELCGESDVK